MTYNARSPEPSLYRSIEARVDDFMCARSTWQLWIILMLLYLVTLTMIGNWIAISVWIVTPWSPSLLSGMLLVVNGLFSPILAMYARAVGENLLFHL